MNRSRFLGYCIAPVQFIAAIGVPLLGTAATNTTRPPANRVKAQALFVKI